MTSTFDVAAARAQFPGLQQEQIFMDNAGKLDRMDLECTTSVTDDVKEAVKPSALWRIREWSLRVQIRPLTDNSIESAHTC